MTMMYLLYEACLLFRNGMPSIYTFIHYLPFTMEIGAALIETANLVLKLLGSPIVKEIQSIRKYETEIKMLANTVQFIEKVLSDVDGKQLQGNSVIEGYKRLREAFLDAEDFLDGLETRKKLREADDSKMKKTLRFFSTSNPANYALEVHNAIKKIRENLDGIAQDLQKFGLKELNTVSEASPMTARATGSYVDAARMTGRDEDKKAIVELLLRSSVDQQNILMILIVGMGGLGKTTLAQLVYNDKGWQEGCMFDMKIWVSDSKKFTLKSLLKKILKSISPTDTSLDNIEEDHLVGRLIEEIRGKRFLLVIDDVETEDTFTWTKLEGLLNTGKKEGSRILVTTRSKQLANVIGPSASTYRLRGLSDESSWGLFEAWAFGNKEGTVPKDLIEIGKFIVEKCKGVPLAIIVVGSLLRGKDRRKWQHVRDNGFAQLKEEGNQVMAILKISYDNLDYTLKQCFSYCALFPKNALIPKETLRDIWMTNVRFETREAVEDVCYNNMEILYGRCFLEVADMQEWLIMDAAFATDDDGLVDVDYFKMHDLMHDLAEEVGGTEMLMLDSNVKGEDKSSFENVRHLSLQNHGTSTSELKRKQLRTFIQVGFLWSKPEHERNCIATMVSDCPLIRMLDLRNSGIKKLTNSIGELIQLRHLDLSDNEFNTLHDSITKLINLRHLNLKGCKALKCLPLGMDKLRSLEVLDISECVKLEELPMSIEKLINLRHLNLAGCRALTCIPVGIHALTSLQVLDISYCDELELLPMRIVKLINLRHLNLAGCKALFLMPSGIGALTSLQVLDISGCDDLYELPKSIEELINLRHLKLAGCKALAWLPFKMEALTQLKLFDISGCSKLSSLPMGIEKLTNLRRLDLTDCHGLTCMPSGIGALMSVCRPHRFVAGYPKSNHTAQLQELGLLLELPEDFEIEINLMLKESRDDEAFLLNKTCLRILYIKWVSRMLEEEEEEDVPKNHMNILAKLQPPTNLEDFGLTGYEGMTFPVWMTKHGFASVLPNLVHLYISECTRCQHLPRLSNLSSLKTLSLVRLKNLEFIEEDNIVSAGTFYPSLENIFLDRLPKLKGWCRGVGTSDDRYNGLELPSFPAALHEVKIYFCPKFRVEANLFSSVKMFGSKLTSSVSFLLQVYTNGGNYRLDKTTNVDGEFVSLMLNSSSFDAAETPLTYMAFREMCDRLTSLEIDCYSGLMALPGMQYLTSLRKLSIGNCFDFTWEDKTYDDEMSWRGLKSLRELTLKDLPNMATLPQGIKFLTSLRRLTLIKLPKMASLPEDIHFVTSLRKLTLFRLPMMVTLPDEIQFITSLEELVITDCANLTLPKWIHKTSLRIREVYDL